ncbi:MAG: hypothetical protein ACPG5T_03515, partial [Endozoicomonas sp.]
MYLQKFVDDFNEKLNAIEGDTKEYQLQLNPDYQGRGKLDEFYFTYRRGRNEEEDWLLKQQMTLSIDFETLGDPLSMTSELVYTDREKNRNLFLFSQSVAADYASQITGQPSARLKSFLTLLFYNQMLNYASPDPESIIKRRTEFLFRLGDVEPLLSILDDSDVEAVERFFSSKPINELASILDGDIISQFKFSLEMAMEKRGYKKASLINKIKSIKDAAQVRRQNGRLQLPVQDPSINPNIENVPLSSGRRSVVEVGVLNPGSRLPIVENDGHYFIAVEVRNRRNPVLQSLLQNTPSTSGLEGWLSLLQDSGAFGRDPAATRYFIENLEKTVSFYEHGRDRFLSLLKDRVTQLRSDAVVQVQETLLELIREQGGSYTKAPGRADLLNALVEVQVKQLNSRLAQGQVTTGDQVYGLIELYKRCESLPQSIETYDGETILIEFDPERSGYDYEYTIKDDRQVMVVGVREDLAYFRQGNNYRVVSDTPEQIEIEVVLDHQKQKGFLPKTRLVINKEHYKQAFIGKRLRPRQLQVDIDALVEQFVAKDSAQRLLVLQKRAGSSLDMNSGREVLVEFMPDWDPEESKVRLFDGTDPTCPVRIQVGTRLSRGQEYSDVAEQLYPLALAASYSDSPGDPGVQESRVDRRRAMVNIIWKQSDRLVNTFGETIGMTSLGDRVPLPGTNRLYYHMLVGHHDFQIQQGTLEDYRYVLHQLMDNGGIEEAMGRAFAFFDEAGTED